MSTRKLSDKEFDRYARNILKKNEGMAFDPSAWAAMEQKMAVEGSSSSAFNLKWIIPAGLLVLSSLGYLGYRFTATPDEVVVEDASPTSIAFANASDKPADTPLLSEASTGSSTQSASMGFNPTSAKSANDMVEQSNERLNAVDRSEESIGTSTPNEYETSSIPTKLPELDEVGESQVVPEQLSSAVLNTNETVATQSEEETINEDIATEQADVTGTGESSASDFQGVTSEPTETSSVVARADQHGNPMIASSDVDETQNQSASPETVESDRDEVVAVSDDSVDVADDLATVEQENEESSEDPFRRWRVGVVLAPDFSTVSQSNEYTRPGMDVGLSVEYLISRRLSVTTGAMLTRKLYNTTDVEVYTVPQGFWQGAGAPDEILADCRVIDIPVNLRYRVVEGTRTSFFLSAGMSSYLMLNERYDYDYGYTGSVGSQPDGWEVSNENNHFFGVYNLSVGITRQVGRNLFIEAEPFLKNSLGGVGWGQVRLRSTGVHLHLKYHF